MAMTKAELERHQAEYYALVTQVRSALQSRRFHLAIELAVSAWPYIDGMMQFERRYESKEFKSIEAIDVVVRLAPLLFDFQCLNKLADLLKAQRRIDKNASADLAANLSNAQALMWEAHRLWKHLEANLDARQDELRKNLGGDQDRWRGIAEEWERIGVVRRTPDGGSYRLALCTRMDEPVHGKCPSCGVVAKARKARMLVETPCPKCGVLARFVILAARPESIKKG